MSVPRVSKLAVISGGTKGLGRSLSLGFGKEGFYVFSLFRSDAESGNRLKEELSSKNIQGEILQSDLTKTLPSLEEIPEADEIVLINNACPPFEPKPFHQLEWTDFLALWEVTVKGSYLLTRHLLKRLINAKSATMINVLSSTIEGPSPKGFAAYNVAKMGLLGLAKSVASEYNARGLRVFCVSPGLMDTPLTAGWNDHLRASIQEKEAFGSPEKAASAIFRLYNDRSLSRQGENYLVS